MFLRVYYYPAPEKEQIILQQYWEMNGKAFVNKPSQIAQAYQMNLLELCSLVRAYSLSEMVWGVCKDCGEELSKIIYTQTDWKQRRPDIVPACGLCAYRASYQAYRQGAITEAFLERQRRELLRKKLLLSGLCRVITDREIEVLEQIILHKGKLRAYVSSLPEADSEELHHIEQSLRGKKLLVESEEQPEPADRVWYEPRLEPIFLSLQPAALLTDMEAAAVSTAAVERKTAPRDHLSFTLMPKIEAGFAEANFAHRLVLFGDVSLKKDTAYQVLGYCNSDGSLQVKIVPRETAHRESGPQPLGDILQDFYRSCHARRDRGPQEE